MEPMATETTKKRIDTAEQQSQQEEAYKLLREKIMQGQLPAGHALPSLALLARKFQLGRTPIYKAVIRLTEEGLIKSRAGSGCFVLPPKEIQLDELQSKNVTLLQKALDACVDSGMTYREIDFVIDNFCRPKIT